MPISEVIREKRKEKGLTQEQLAKRLGVSAPAVNKWEKGSTYPDIELLPVLARLLDTDLNTLLCFEKELSEKEIGTICTEITREAQEKGIMAGAALAEKRIQEYPNCAQLIQMAAMTIQGCILFAEAKEEEQREIDDKICLWYERAVECGENGSVRERAAYMLAGKFLAEKELEKAEKMLSLIPDEMTDKRALQASLLEKKGEREEAAVLLERWIQEDLIEINQALLKLMLIAVEEGDDARAERIAEIGSSTALLYEMWGYNSLLLPMELALKRKDKQKSLEYIRKIVSLLKEPFPEVKVSPLLVHVDAQKKKMMDEKHGENMLSGEAEKEYRRKVLSALIRAMRSDKEEFGFLAEDECFKKLLEE